MRIKWAQRKHNSTLEITQGIGKILQGITIFKRT